MFKKLSDPSYKVKWEQLHRAGKVHKIASGGTQRAIWDERMPDHCFLIVPVCMCVCVCVCVIERERERERARVHKVFTLFLRVMQDPCHGWIRVITVTLY